MSFDLTFLWLLWPFSGAILWGTVLAIVFAPIYRGLRFAFGVRNSIATVTTILIILLIVILQMTAISAALVREISTFYDRVQTGEINFEVYFKSITDSLPHWVGGLELFGLNGFVIGPVIAATFITVWEIFSDSRQTALRE